MFCSVVFYVNEETINQTSMRLTDYGRIEYRLITKPDKKGAVYVVDTDIWRNEADYFFLTRKLFEGVHHNAYLMLMQDADISEENEIYGNAWDAPYRLDFICDRYIEIDGLKNGINA